MNNHELEQKLKDLAAATAPDHSLVNRVMQRVNEAHQPRHRSIYRLLPASSVLRTAAILAIAAGIAVIAVGLHSLRTPRHPAPLVEAHNPFSDGVAVRVLDIRRIDFRSPDALDDLLRDGSSIASHDPVIRVADLSRPDLNLY
jgi:hypothetical protein